MYYGWVLAWTLGVTETVSWGILFYAFGVFLQPMEAELGWTRAQLSGAYTAGMLVWGIASLPAGRWVDRHGARRLMTLGSCAGVLLVLAWSAVQHLAVFYAIWIFMGAAMAATLYDPAFAVLAVWFRRYRARAMMVVTLMAGLASTIFLPLAAWLVELQGWRTALVTLAVILAITTIPPHALLLRRRPQDLGLLPDGRPTTDDRRPTGLAEESTAPSRPAATSSESGQSERTPSSANGAVGGRPPSVVGSRSEPAEPAEHGDVGASLRRLMGHAPFRWLALAFCLYGLASLGVSVHLVPLLAERGYSPAEAAGAAGAVGAAQLLGRIAFAPLEGRVSRRWLTAAVLGAQPLAILALLLPVPSGASGYATAAIWCFILLFGISRGAATLARATLIAAQYGPARYGGVSGTLTLVITLSNAVAPVALGATHDLFRTYVPGLWLMITLSALASVAALLADRDE